MRGSLSDGYLGATVAATGLVGIVGIVVGIGASASASLTLAAAIGILFMTVATKSLPLGFCAFVFLTFFDRSTPLQSGGLTIVKATGAALTLLWLREVARNRRDTPMLFRSHPRLSFAVLFLACWTVASALWAEDHRLALTGGSGSAFRLAQGVLLLYIVFTFFRERRHLWWLVWSFLGGAAFAALIGLTGIYGVTQSVNDARLSGGFDDPNELAAVLVPALVLSAFAFVAAPGRLARWACVALAGLFLYALAQTDSQAGIVALAVALILAIALSGRVRPLAIATVTAFLLAGTAYYTFYTRPVALETIASPSNVGARETLWTVAGRVVHDHPVAGVGAGNFVVAEPPYTATGTNLPRSDLVVRPELVHNSYLQVWAELGTIGLIAFLAVIGGSVLLALRAVRTAESSGDRELEMLSRGFLIATVSMLAAYFFATNQYEKQLWLVIAVGPALASIAARSAVARATVLTRAPALRQPGVRSGLRAEGGPAVAGVR
ncbi:MAG TPA: O-antigen ligase family protein [Gaiellaceae bacterium]|nr:O-antigen ligase family protein [Gaiellaceae bacterium]